MYKRQVWIYYEGDSFGESIFGLSTKIISLQTWIKKLPDINYSNKLDETVWEFESDNLLYFLFGNDKPENGSFELGDGSPEPFEEDGSKLGINYLSKNNTATSDRAAVVTLRLRSRRRLHVLLKKKIKRQILQVKQNNIHTR